MKTILGGFILGVLATSMVSAFRQPSDPAISSDSDVWPESVAADSDSNCADSQGGVRTSSGAKGELVADSQSNFASSDVYAEISVPTQSETAADVPDREAHFISSSQKSSENRVNRSDGATTAPVVDMPQHYQELLAPEPEKPMLTPSELHQAFMQEPRDESWAYTMETGIFHSAAQFNNSGAVVDFVACRSTMCEVGGYAVPGSPFAHDELIETMRQSGWWQLGTQSNTAGGIVDGTYRFVAIIPRFDDVFTRTSN